MSVNERLARMEEKQDQVAAKVTAIFDLMNPLIKKVERQGEAIKWMVRIGGSALVALGTALGIKWH